MSSGPGPDTSDDDEDERLSTQDAVDGIVSEVNVSMNTVSMSNSACTMPSMIPPWFCVSSVSSPADMATVPPVAALALVAVSL